MRTHHRAYVVVACLLVAGGARLHAMENRQSVYPDDTSGAVYPVNDLRGELGILPAHASQGITWDSNIRLGIQAVRSRQRMGDHGCLIYGGEFSYNVATDPKVDMNSEVLTGMVGWGYKLPSMPAVHFEATPFLGLGFAQLQAAGGNHADSLYYEYGIRAAVFYTFVNRWQMGADLRIMRDHVSPDFGSGNSNLETNGPALLFEVGRRF